MTYYDLPYPPTVNTYWRANGHRRFIAKRGVEFREQVADIVADTRQGSLDGRLSVFVALYPPDKRKRDIDNVLKALLDALTHAGAYDDDSQIDRLEVVRHEVIKGGKCSVVIVGAE